MKICFLGTSHGVPEKERFCSCTAISINDSIYVIDAGVSLFSALRHNDLSPDNVKGIFLTHNHGDHSSGLAEYVDLISWSRKEVNPAIFMPTREAADAMHAWVKLMDNGRDIELSVTHEGVIFHDENVKVTAIRTLHANPSFAYMLEAEGKRIVFTGDIKRTMEDYPSVILNEHCDLVVCECAHVRVGESADILSKSNTDLMIFNHINPRHGYEQFDMLKEHGTPFKIILSNDSDVFEI